MIFDLFVCLGNEIFCGTVSVTVWYFASQNAFPISLKLCCEGEWQCARHPHGRVVIALLPSERSCLSPFEKFSTRTWEINELSEEPPPEREKKHVCL